MITLYFEDISAERMTAVQYSRAAIMYNLSRIDEHLVKLAEDDMSKGRQFSTIFPLSIYVCSVIINPGYGDCLMVLIDYRRDPVGAAAYSDKLSDFPEMKRLFQDAIRNINGGQKKYEEFLLVQGDYRATVRQNSALWLQ